MKDLKVDVTKLNEYLGKVSPTPLKCSVCGGVDTFDSEDYVMQMPQFEYDIYSSYHVLPVVALTCRNCGNTILLNAVSVGLVNSESQEGEDNNGN